MHRRRRLGHGERHGAAAQWACGSNQSHQGWQFRTVRGSVRKVAGAATTNGSPTQLRAYGGGGNPRWTSVLRADGYYQFVGLPGGRRLTVAGGDGSIGRHRQDRGQKCSRHHTNVTTPLAGSS